MQQRFKVASTDTFEEAHQVKTKLLSDFPDRKFQIRKSRNKFTIVERVSVVKAQQKKENKGGRTL